MNAVQIRITAAQEEVKTLRLRTGMRGESPSRIIMIMPSGQLLASYPGFPQNGVELCVCGKPGYEARC